MGTSHTGSSPPHQPPVSACGTGDPTTARRNSSKAQSPARKPFPGITLSSRRLWYSLCFTPKLVDIPRPQTSKRRRQYVQGGIAAGAVVLLTILLTSLKPAAPGVDRAIVQIDTVHLGTMVREVRGPGTLVPEHIRFITALAAGRVDRVLAQPGQSVQPGTVLLELSNPDVQIQSLQAEQQLTAAQAQLVSLRTSLQAQRLTQEGVVATTHTEYGDAKRQAMVADSLAGQHLVAANDAALAKDKAAEMETRYRIERERLTLMTETIDSQLAVQQSQVERLRAIAEFQRNVVRSLEVRAGDSGVVSDLTVDGTIEIERLERVLHVGRPAYGQPNSTIGMFKLVEGGDYAVRVPVQVGRSSVNSIEVVQGLKAGDEVILSDMSRWDSVDRVRMK